MLLNTRLAVEHITQLMKTKRQVVQLMKRALRCVVHQELLSSWAFTQIKVSSCNCCSVALINFITNFHFQKKKKLYNNFKELFWFYIQVCFKKKKKNSLRRYKGKNFLMNYVLFKYHASLAILFFFNDSFFASKVF